MSWSPDSNQPADDAKLRGDLSRKMMDGLFWVTSSYGIQAILRLVVVAVIARLITPEEFGLMGAAGVVLGFASYVTEFGLFSAIEQRPNIEERHLRTAFTVYVTLGALFGIVIYFGAGLIANFFRMNELVPIVQALALAFPLLAFEALPKALLKRKMRFRWLAGLNVISYGLGLGVVGVILAWLGFGVWALVGATFAGLIISIVFLLIVQPYPKRPQIDREALRELTFYGSGFTLGRIFIYAGEQADNLVVGRWLGASALGIYGRAYQLLVFPVSLFGTALKQVLIPSMAKLQHEPEQMGATYREAISLTTLVFLPVSAAAIILAPELVLTLLGRQWAEVIIPFQVLAAGIFFRANYMISDSMIQATGAVYRRASRTAIFAALTFAGALIGQFWGVTGVAAGVLVALAMNSFLLAELCMSLVKLSWMAYIKSMKHGLLLAATTLAVVWPATIAFRNLALPHYAVLVGSALVTGLTLLLLLYLVPSILLGQDGQFMVQSMASLLVSKVRPQVPVQPVKE